MRPPEPPPSYPMRQTVFWEWQTRRCWARPSSPEPLWSQVCGPRARPSPRTAFKLRMLFFTLLKIIKPPNNKPTKKCRPPKPKILTLWLSPEKSPDPGPIGGHLRSTHGAHPGFLNKAHKDPESWFQVTTTARTGVAGVRKTPGACTRALACTLRRLAPRYGT